MGAMAEEGNSAVSGRLRLDSTMEPQSGGRGVDSLLTQCVCQQLLGESGRWGLGGSGWWGFGGSRWGGGLEDGWEVGTGWGPCRAGRCPFRAAPGAGGRHTRGEVQSPVTAVSRDTSPP